MSPWSSNQIQGKQQLFYESLTDFKDHMRAIILESRQSSSQLPSGPEGGLKRGGRSFDIRRRAVSAP
jgi:hypothetical protein